MDRSSFELGVYAQARQGKVLGGQTKCADPDQPDRHDVANSKLGPLQMKIAETSDEDRPESPIADLGNLQSRPKDARYRTCGWPSWSVLIISVNGVCP